MHMNFGEYAPGFQMDVASSKWATENKVGEMRVKWASETNGLGKAYERETSVRVCRGRRKKKYKNHSCYTYKLVPFSLKIIINTYLVGSMLYVGPRPM